MAKRRRIRVKGIRKDEDPEMLALAMWLGSRRKAIDGYERKKSEKAKRQERRG
jgi:capsid protein